MFTGLAQDIGRVVSISSENEEAQLSIATKLSEFTIGESIAVMGACLSVVEFAPGRFTAFASRETLSKTGLGELRSGSRVNLERALRLVDRLGGHMVSGHVDTRVRLLDRQRVGQAEQWTFELPEPPLADQIAPKGSVAIDGISLTVNTVDPIKKRFDVMIIPITLADTTLGALKPGQSINLETDVIAKYVARLLGGGSSAAAPAEGLNFELLAKSGFMR